MDRVKKQIETLFEMAKEKGLRPMWTHYRKADGSLGATSCVLLDSECNPVARGVTVVSEKDNPSKAVGRAIAIKRAYAAAVSEKTPLLKEELCLFGECDLTGEKEPIQGLPPYLQKASRYPYPEALTPTEQWKIEKRTNKK